MFRKLAGERTHRDDRRLAGYLASIAGAVNSAGFVLIGSFTSHVTGNVGRLADQVALGNAAIAFSAAAAIIAFYVGAVITSVAIESSVRDRTSRASAAVLAIEALLIAAFVVAHGEPPLDAHRAVAESMLLSTAMGMQNSLVTRLSGAVVRTTHLTGVVTDLGIESARWFRYWRATVAEGLHVRLTFTGAPVTKPVSAKAALLATIFAAFVVGSATGAILAVRYGARSLLSVIAVLVAGSVYALLSGRSVVKGPGVPRPERRTP